MNTFYYNKKKGNYFNEMTMNEMMENEGGDESQYLLPGYHSISYDELWWKENAYRYADHSKDCPYGRGYLGYITNGEYIGW